LISLRTFLLKPSCCDVAISGKGHDMHQVKPNQHENKIIINFIEAEFQSRLPHCISGHTDFAGIVRQDISIRRAFSPNQRVFSLLSFSVALAFGNIDILLVFPSDQFLPCDNSKSCTNHSGHILHDHPDSVVAN